MLENKQIVTQWTFLNCEFLNTRMKMKMVMNATWLLDVDGKNNLHDEMLAHLPQHKVCNGIGKMTGQPPIFMRTSWNHNGTAYLSAIKFNHVESIKHVWEFNGCL